MKYGYYYVCDGRFLGGGNNLEKVIGKAFSSCGTAQAIKRLRIGEVRKNKVEEFIDKADIRDLRAAGNLGPTALLDLITCRLGDRVCNAASAKASEAAIAKFKPNASNKAILAWAIEHVRLDPDLRCDGYPFGVALAILDEQKRCAKICENAAARLKNQDALDPYTLLQNCVSEMRGKSLSLGRYEGKFGLSK